MMNTSLIKKSLLEAEKHQNDERSMFSVKECDKYINFFNSSLKKYFPNLEEKGHSITLTIGDCSEQLGGDVDATTSLYANGTIIVKLFQFYANGSEILHTEYEKKCIILHELVHCVDLIQHSSTMCFNAHDEWFMSQNDILADGYEYIWCCTPNKSIVLGDEHTYFDINKDYITVICDGEDMYFDDDDDKPHYEYGEEVCNYYPMTDKFEGSPVVEREFREVLGNEIWYTLGPDAVVELYK